MKTITIRVTNKDIVEGRKKKIMMDSTRNCPIAIAARRAVILDVRVFPSHIHALGWAITLPKLVQSWIVAFDNDKPVKPFTFRIRVPTKN